MNRQERGVSITYKDGGKTFFIDVGPDDTLIKFYSRVKERWYEDDEALCYPVAVWAAGINIYTQSCYEFAYGKNVSQEVKDFIDDMSRVKDLTPEP